MRLSNDYSVNAVLDTDIKKFLELREAKNPDAEGYILPIPKNLAQLEAIASSQLYCEKRGFGQ
ncbi:hypothetical protein [Aphanothece sacrum]|uniref:CRISPR-associated helicase Cas3 n=1 Tax=Aphanothece sacrum FPU1 TaxID=1920663 RepID=A0A401INQ9_APHSA|nr:hypothetical protein [Aphanothece sacrum]GBF82867.1 CRISPR-associated helicase Cas3 [Aphanothece sacrum FPU1]GBF86256.1 CRISPR-associated helicase Cas3 [Aphanothece sacrum FPU3]